MKTILEFLTLIIILGIFSCKNKAEIPELEGEESLAPLAFTPRLIIDSAQHWWAHCPADITGDGVVDIAFIHNNSTGGYLGYYTGRKDSSKWERTIVAEKSPEGLLFAAGDLETADMDGDGDIDFFAVQHPGEWQDANAEATLYWYENPSWEAHRIGTVPDAVKDINFADFNKDGHMDLSVLTFEENTLSIFAQGDTNNWERVQYYSKYNNLHEGMNIGDINGDGFLDIAANGLVFYNPSGQLKERWETENIDSIWNNQKGDWSRNGTKHFTQDLDGDGRAEVFVSHSERAGYPLVYYSQSSGEWKKHIIADSIPACHTLQVYDFDLDGDFDVLAGVNWARSVNLGIEDAPITVFLSDKNYTTWVPMVMEEKSIYNGQAADYDGDGDMDFFRYPNHEATQLFLYENMVK